MVGEINFGALQAPDYFGNALRARDAGRTDRIQGQRDAALAKYSTDPSGGIKDLMGVDPEAALQLQRAQAAQAQADARRTAGGQAATGDITGARTTALQSGDLDFADAISKMDEASRTAAAKRAETLATVGYGLRKLPYEQRKAALMQAAPQLGPMGLSAEQLSGFDPTDENIDQQVNLAIGIKGAIEQHDKATKPVEFDPTKRYYLPGDEPGVAGAQPAAASPAPAHAGGGLNLDTVWGAVKQQESGGNGDAVSSQGAIGSTQMLPATAEGMARKLGIAWNPSLMRGNTPNALAYQDKLGRAYFEEGLQKSGGDVAGALAYYHGGPDPAQHGPKTAKYVTDVLGRIGAQPYEVAANGSTPGPAAPKIPGYHMIQDASPEWRADGHGVLVNTMNGDRKKDPSYEEPAAVADPNVVKMVLDGRYPPPTGKAATSPMWQAVVEAAAAQDPSFNAADYHTRFATRKDFTSGKSAQNITALNTALGHIGELASKIDGLGNTRFPMVNALKAGVQTGMGDNRYTNFDADKKAVASELVRVFRGAGGAEADIKDFQQQLDSAGSPAQLKGVTQEMVKLLASRLDALSAQYKQGLGQDKAGIEFLTPKAQKIYSKLMGVPVPGGADAQPNDAIAQARDAIQRGADRNAVIQRLRQHGVDPAGL